ncbi:MAG: TetR/AcrR family transcriptional regulator [Clostridiales bacterium]|jgi:AcrR family transcriptional regulator|nr:TetR/AcrR family transcriptional regulator [Clostridiales bacterium]
MIRYNKGLETESRILFAARTLFFEKGYAKTSVREIADRSGSNLGLLNYYFGSKSEIGLRVYRTVRGEANAMMEGYGSDPSGSVSGFLLANLIELEMTLISAPYGRFFAQAMSEPTVQSFYRQRIVAGLEKYMRAEADKDYSLLTCISISAIKPALVSWAHGGGAQVGSVSHDFILRYYLDQYVHFLGGSPDLADRVFAELKRYHVNIAENFTPIIVPIASR